MAKQPAFSPAELTAIEAQLKNLPVRDRTLFVFMYATGLRITEALQTKIRDVLCEGRIRSEILVARARLKGGRGVHRHGVQSRIIPLSDVVRPALQELVAELIGSSPSPLELAQPLFPGRFPGSALCRRQATYIMRDLLLRAGLADRSGFGWHATRRTFAGSIYELTGHDLNITCKVLGHRNLATTQEYLATDSRAIAASILAHGARGLRGQPRPFDLTGQTAA